MMTPNEPQPRHFEYQDERRTRSKQPLEIPARSPPGRLPVSSGQCEHYLSPGRESRHGRGGLSPKAAHPGRASGAQRTLRWPHPDTGHPTGRHCIDGLPGRDWIESQQAGRAAHCPTDRAHSMGSKRTACWALRPLQQQTPDMTRMFLQQPKRGIPPDELGQLLTYYSVFVTRHFLARATTP